MTGGGVEIDDKNRKESLIIKGEEILKSKSTLKLKLSINDIIKYGLIKEESVNSLNEENNYYSFIHLSF